ncbi:MAG: DUF2232 domain-containing protein [Clostridiaceae bacterium]|nr:YybS family protein [Eubacteriales bacterium]
MGAFFPVLLLLMPAFLGFVGAAWGTACLLTALGGAAAALFLLVADAATALYMLAAFAPASLILAYVLLKKRPYRHAVIAMSAVLALFGYAILCLPSMLAGGSPFDAAVTAVSAEVKRLLPLLPQLFASQEQAAFMETYLTAAVDLVPELVVALILGLSEAFAFLDTLLARALLKRAKAELRPMAPFLLWQLPKDFLWGALILAAGAAACSFLNLNNAAAIAAAAECIIVPPFALMGLALFEFSVVFSRQRAGGRRVFIYIALLLLFPSSLVVLAGFGVIDRIIKARGRAVHKK